MAKAKRLSRKQYIKWLQAQGESREPMTREVAYQILDGQLHLLRPDEVDSSLVDDCLDYLYPDRTDKEYPDIEKTWQRILTTAQEQMEPAQSRIKGMRMRPALVVVTIALLVLALGTTVASALGFNVWQYVFSWANDVMYIEKNVAPENTYGGATTAPFGRDDVGQVFFAGVDDLFSQALTKYGVSPILPKWKPDGFSNPNVSMSISDTLSIIIAIYEGQDGREFIASVEWYDGPFSSVLERNEDEEPILIQRSGFDFWLISNVNRKELIWIDEPYMVSIGGDLTEDELMMMIDSIFEEKMD